MPDWSNENGDGLLYARLWSCPFRLRLAESDEIRGGGCRSRSRGDTERPKLGRVVARSRKDITLYLGSTAGHHLETDK